MEFFWGLVPFWSQPQVVIWGTAVLALPCRSSLEVDAWLKLAVNLGKAEGSCSYG